MSDDATLKRREDAKHDAAWDPRARWQAILDAINWADAQQPLPRNEPASSIFSAHPRESLGDAMSNVQP